MTRLQERTLLLCEKIREVLDNNDWPTEEGQDRENQKSKIRLIVEEIEGLI